MSRIRVNKLRPRRILFDLSFTCTSGKMSGIERVVRSLLREGQAGAATILANESIEFVPVFASDGDFYRWNPQTQAVLAQTADIERDCLSATPLLYQYLAPLVCRVLPHPGLRRCLLPPAGHLGIFKPWFRRWKKRAVSRAAIGQSPLAISAEDILWLPDAYWAQPSVWPAVHAARRSGALVATLVYDLIPLRSKQGHPVFAEYLHRLLADSDLALCISDCERRNLVSFQALSAESSAQCKAFQTISLGCEFQQTSGEVRPQFSLPFAEPVYLCVNTFDPRKNHSLLLDVFDRLWASGSSARLCLIGRVGWQCKPILQRIARHTELNRQLFVFHDASDAEVNYCYQRARGVITASKDEGFGLPVVESLSRGRTTFASDIPIHREVGGNACHYFDPERVDELEQLIRCDQAGELGMSHLGQSAQNLPPKIHSWRESFEQCCSELLSSYQRRASRTTQAKAA